MGLVASLEKQDKEDDPVGDGDGEAERARVRLRPNGGDDE